MYLLNKALGIPNNKQEQKISTIWHTYYYIGPVTNHVKHDTFILWVIVSTKMAWLLFMVNWDDWSLWTNQIVALNSSTFLINPVRKYDNIVMNKLHYCKYKQIWMHVAMSIESCFTMVVLICTQQLNSTQHHQLLLHNKKNYDKFFIINPYWILIKIHK